MKITIEAIKNGFVVSLQNPMSSPESFYVQTWEQVKGMINGLQISDGPPKVDETDSKTVPVVPPTTTA